MDGDKADQGFALFRHLQDKIDAEHLRNAWRLCHVKATSDGWEIFFLEDDLEM
jgi:hypothetical protein